MTYYKRYTKKYLNGSYRHKRRDILEDLLKFPIEVPKSYQCNKSEARQSGRVIHFKSHERKVRVKGVGDHFQALSLIIIIIIIGVVHI